MELPPTALPPAPRLVRGGPGPGIWFARIFLLPHTLVGVGGFVALAIAIVCAATGNDRLARVTAATSSHSAKHGTSYHLAYVYSGAAGVRADGAQVGEGLYRSTPGTIRVRVLEVGPLSWSTCVEEHSAWQPVGFIALFTGFWNLIVSVFVYALWIAPIRARWLVRDGQVTRGEVVSKRVQQGKGRAFFVTFRFQEPATEADLSVEMGVRDSSAHARIQVGEPVTVIYDPRKPKRALAYEYCGYTVAGAERD
jgi:hypothetical protein